MTINSLSLSPDQACAALDSTETHSERTDRTAKSPGPSQSDADGIPTYTCPGCDEAVPCDVAHRCDGLLDLPDGVPVAPDFANVVTWHRYRNARERGESLALYQQLLFRRLALIVTSDLELVVGPDEWLEEDDREAIARYRGWLMEHVRTTEIEERTALRAERERRLAEIIATPETPTETPGLEENDR